MNWYYLNGEMKAGPFSEATMLELRSCGVLSDETMVLREGSEEWGCYRDLFQAVMSNPHIPVVFKFDCPHCQQNISAEADYSGMNVQCPTCGVDFVVPSPAGGTELKTIPSQAIAAESSSCPEKSVEAEQPNPSTEVGSNIPSPISQESQTSIAAHSASAIPSTQVTARSVYTASSSTDLAPAFSISRLIPLFVCCLGLGWIAGGFLMPNTFFISTNIIGQIIPVTMLGVPALILAIIGICHFVRPLRFPTKRAVCVLLFTMVVGLVGLLIFQEIAVSRAELKFQSHGKSSIFVLIVKLIGKAYECVNNPDSTVLEKIFGYIFGVGLCEEATKLLPLFFLVVAGDNRPNKTDYRGFLILGFFSGLGFGIGEAIYGYAPWSGNLGAGSNVLRWFALVPSHAIWTVIDAAFLWLLAPKIISADNNYSKFGFFVLCVMVVAVVHGVYDVLCGIPGMGILFSVGSIFLMYFVVVWVAKKSGETGTIKQQENGISTGIVGWLKNSKAGQMRLGRIYAACPIMIAGSLIFSDKEPVLSVSERSSFSESQHDQPSAQKRKANRIAFDLYMQGYDDPIQGEVAESMMKRVSGEKAQACAIIALGGQDRRAGLPPRFELDPSL